MQIKLEYNKKQSNYDVRKQQQIMSVWIKLAAKSRVKCEQNAIRPATAELINPFSSGSDSSNQIFLLFCEDRMTFPTCLQHVLEPNIKMNRCVTWQPWPSCFWRYKSNSCLSGFSKWFLCDIMLAFNHRKSDSPIISYQNIRYVSLINISGPNGHPGGFWWRIKWEKREVLIWSITLYLSVIQSTREGPNDKPWEAAN